MKGTCRRAAPPVSDGVGAAELRLVDGPRTALQRGIQGAGRRAQEQAREQLIAENEAFAKVLKKIRTGH